MTRASRAVVLAMSMWISACSAYYAYDGPRRPESAVSIISLGDGVGFVRIDEDRDPGVRGVVHIEPGEHMIGLRYGSNPSCWLSAKTEAGLRYVAEGSSRGKGFVIELVDTSSGRAVGSCESIY